MLLNTFGSRCATTKKSLIKENLHFYKNIRKSMMNVKQISNDQYGASEGEEEEGVNLFRPVFKKYKKRVPPPDFSNVIDIRESQNLEKYGLESRFLFDNPSNEDQKCASRLGLRPLPEWRVCHFRSRPGLYLLPGIMLKSSSAEWLERSLNYALSPNTTNLTAHGTEITDKSLRWTTLGVEYDWDTKEYPKSGRELPEELRSLARLVSNGLGLGEMRADAAIVNYYPPKATLSPHVDRSERCDAPLISMSIGQTAVYLTGGTSLGEEPIPIWLRNGDILVMHAAQRLVYHAIPCVAVKSQLERFDDVENQRVKEYLNSSRVNITIRQVNPH